MDGIEDTATPRLGPSESVQGHSWLAFAAFVLACLLSRASCPRTVGDEHAAESELNWLAQAAVLSAGWRLAGPVPLPFGCPGDLPHGFGGSARVPTVLT